MNDVIREQRYLAVYASRKLDYCVIASVQFRLRMQRTAIFLLPA